MIKKALKLISALYCLAIALNTNAQNAGELDTTFNPGTGASNTVRAVALQSDGKIIIGGEFTTYNGIAASRIARINSNGDIDSTFTSGTGANSTIHAAAIQADGKIIIGGEFTIYNGVSLNHIARLNSDGTLDNSFTVGLGFTRASAFAPPISTICIQSDGKIIIGGEFTGYNGASAPYIIRLNEDGTIDNSFAIGTGAGNIIKKITVQTDGKILVGGGFTVFNGITGVRLIRLNSDGTRDNTFNASLNQTVSEIAFQSDGKIIIGGAFTQYGSSSPLTYIARLNTDGSLDNTFSLTGTGLGFTNFVYAAVQSDDKIVIAGSFTDYNGSSVRRVTRLNNNGSLDTSFSSSAGTALNNSAHSVILQNDGKIIAIGAFTNYNGINRRGIVRIIAEDQAIGIKEKINSNEFSIYPNPANDIVNINSVIPNTTIKIINLSGQLIHSIEASDSMETIRIGNLSNGLYFIEVEMNNKTTIKKLIVNH